MAFALPRFAPDVLREYAGGAEVKALEMVPGTAVAIKFTSSGGSLISMTPGPDGLTFQNGDCVLLCNVGAYSFDIKNDDASETTPSKRFATPGTSITVPVRGAVLAVRLPSSTSGSARWRVAKI